VVADWELEALCARYDVDPFAETRQGVLAVMNLCRDCPVARDCRRQWERTPVPFGVWGGRHASQLLRERSARVGA
jgi:hypothetical protein